ncbi:unnamed protein product [Zymoseptoria tritici ST99CH_1E4]|uniref:Zn(2)-C6 fungal-type domain-containing protein n=1 Tax=Zymoseptoria tritici ST99CH_1E4 TaxID=1276532 RepID=A0A2H1H0N8_ZYMTR|nr:unnamed protein product [Zymoseptoria tritici ST99CH_1E4]
MLSSVPEHSGHRCSICEKTFSTSSHLRRHEALHNGRVTATCPSCDKRFSRLDTARRHVAACSRSQTEPIVLEPGRRGGRERKACVTCSQRKLACDGGSPCARCVSSQVPCSYQHRQFDGLTPDVDTPGREPEVSEAAIAAAPTSPNNVPGKVPISFRLAFTAPAEHRATATLLDVDDGQHVDSMPYDEILDVPPASGFSLEYFDALFWDQQSWATEFLDFTSYAPEDVNSVAFPTPPSRTDAILNDRLTQIRQQLASTHARLLAKDPTFDAHFDQRLAEQVFTARNLQLAVQTYFRLLNPFYPFIHRPSFDCETVTSYLLLAVFLFGCLALPSTDLNSLRARSLTSPKSTSLMLLLFSTRTTGLRLTKTLKCSKRH